MRSTADLINVSSGYHYFLQTTTFCSSLPTDRISRYSCKSIHGYSGALNDLNKLNLPSLLERMTDASFRTLEKEAGVATGGPFNRLFLLVDEVYCRFERGFKELLTETQKKHTA